MPSTLLSQHDDMRHIRRAAAQDGFSMIELMLVMIVLGILAGIVLLATGSYNTTAERAACASEVRTVLNASSAYRLRTGADAPNLDVLVDSGILEAKPKFVTLADGVVDPPTVSGCG